MECDAAAGGRRFGLGEGGPSSASRHLRGAEERADGVGALQNAPPVIRGGFRFRRIAQGWDDSTGLLARLGLGPVQFARLRATTKALNMAHFNGVRFSSQSIGPGTTRSVHSTRSTRQPRRSRKNAISSGLVATVASSSG